MKQNVIIMVIMFLIGSFILWMDTNVVVGVLVLVVEIFVIAWYDAERRATKWEIWYFKELNRDRDEIK